MNTGIIVALLLGLALVGGVIYIIARVQGAARQISQAAFGTDSFAEGVKRQTYEYENTPKSLASATSLYLPQIKEDFPQFNFEEARTRAANVLTGYLRGIDQADAGQLSEGAPELHEALAQRITMLQDVGQREQFDKIKVHDTQISRYRKEGGRCSIVFQSSVQYKHALLDAGGKLLKGSTEALEQGRYNITMAYVQDASRSEDERDWALGLNCPNCGAPVKTLGQKTCEYCGTGLVEMNLNVWRFYQVEEA